MGEAPLKFAPYFLQAGLTTVAGVDYEQALPLYQVHSKRYESWIARGSHGEMEYLKRGLDRRLNPKLVFPVIESVITVLMPYSTVRVGSDQLRYARYLNGEDYHHTLITKISSAMVKMKEENPTLEYKVCVDTSAVLERTWAAICGLGWIGKNTLLIHPQLGSYVFIGVVFLNQRLGLAPQPLKDYCGHCTRCLTACPTNALPEPHYLESRDCIIYLTLEKRGPWSKPVDPKGFVAGCDLCQEVCPFNVKATLAEKQSGDPLPSHLEFDLNVIQQETEVQYQARVKGTALSRVKYADFKRNMSAILKLKSDS